MMAEVLKDFELQIEAFTLVPSDGGKFEVTVDGTLIYSKLDTGQHVFPGQVVGLIRKYIEEK
jgi:selenoprotein W-related protein